MDFYNCLHLLPIVLLLAFPLAFFIRNLLLRVAIVLAASCLFLLPILPQSTSVAMRAFSFFNYLSFSLVVAMVSALFRLRWNLKIKDWLIILVVGGFLYGSALGYLPVDLYRFGYKIYFSIIIAGLLIVLLSYKCAFVITIAFSLYLSGVYVNFWDALIDPVFWFVSLVNLVLKVRNPWLAKRK